MKRIQLTPTAMKEGRLPHDLPKDLTDYMARLDLLYEVPFSYLIADEDALPPESIRFFYIDQNWTEALVEGAFSIGRATGEDARNDKAQLRSVSPPVKQRLRRVRQMIMHENHKCGLTSADEFTASDIQSGFLIRSVLVRRMKGLEVTGSDGNRDLHIIRMEELSDEVLICIFDGELAKLVIAEPMVGLRFGSPDDKRVIRVRAVTDDDNFGQYLKDSVNLNEFTEENGKLNVADLAGQFDTVLGMETGSAQVAFELIATAHRAEFKKNE